MQCPVVLTFRLPVALTLKSVVPALLFISMRFAVCPEAPVMMKGTAPLCFGDARGLTKVIVSALLSAVMRSALLGLRRIQLFPVVTTCCQGLFVLYCIANST